MSLRDVNLIFSAAQALTTTADSTSTVDLGTGTDYLAATAIPESSYSGQMRLVIRVGTTAFASGTNIQATLQDSANNSSFAATEIQVPAVLTASLTAGALVCSIPLPVGLRRYLKIVYTISGTYNAGTMDAWLEAM